MEWLGEGNILFASDYPHWDSQFPEAVLTLADRVDVSDLFKRKIFLDNPCRYYELDLDRSMSQSTWECFSGAAGV